jgi:hypothetical protein
MGTIEKMNNLNNRIQEGSTWTDWHALVTIQFGELIESGFDWGKNDYFKNSAFTEANRTRLNQKIEDRFYFREICSTPAQFKFFLRRRLNEILPKYNELYKLIDSGDFKVLRQMTKNEKFRNVFSEYPQTQLNGDANYATNATDNASGSTTDGSPIEMILNYHQYYDDVDVMILNDPTINNCFLSMMPAFYTDKGGM